MILSMMVNDKYKNDFLGFGFEDSNELINESNKNIKIVDIDGGAYDDDVSQIYNKKFYESDAWVDKKDHFIEYNKVKNTLYVSFNFFFDKNRMSWLLKIIIDFNKFMCKQGINDLKVDLRVLNVDKVDFDCYYKLTTMFRYLSNIKVNINIGQDVFSNYDEKYFLMRLFVEDYRIMFKSFKEDIFEYVVNLFIINLDSKKMQISFQESVTLTSLIELLRDFIKVYNESSDEEVYLETNIVNGNLLITKVIENELNKQKDELEKKLQTQIGEFEKILEGLGFKEEVSYVIEFDKYLNKYNVKDGMVLKDDISTFNVVEMQEFSQYLKDFLDKLNQVIKKFEEINETTKRLVSFVGVKVNYGLLERRNNCNKKMVFCETTIGALKTFSKDKIKEPLEALINSKVIDLDVKYKECDISKMNNLMDKGLKYNKKFEIIISEISLAHINISQEIDDIAKIFNLINMFNVVSKSDVSNEIIAKCNLTKAKFDDLNTLINRFKDFENKIKSLNDVVKPSKNNEMDAFIIGLITFMIVLVIVITLIIIYPFIFNVKQVEEDNMKETKINVF